MIEKQLGKVVFNVANSPTAAGSSLFEILQRSPGVSIDQNENHALRNFFLIPN